MAMRTRAEKRMRKFLIEQLKTRQQNGARIAQGKKSEHELIKNNLGPQVLCLEIFSVDKYCTPKFQHTMKTKLINNF